MKVLCVSPRFAPVNGADSHRLRLLVRHLSACGCKVDVLAVESASAGLAEETGLRDLLPEDITIHRVPVWRLRGWGLGGLAQRSAVPLYREGLRLLRASRFDLVFFSTTEFLLHLLGPAWQARTGVPFCMDYQDPWVNDYYKRTGARPPGGRVKYACSQWLHRIAERVVAPRASGFISVSGDYLASIENRYGHGIAVRPRLVAAFPAEPLEFIEAPARAAARTRTDEGANTSVVWRYVGRGGPDMARAARGFFAAWQQAIEHGILAARDARLELAGTSYARAGEGQPSIAPLAADFNLRHAVRESTDRLPYLQTLQLLSTSDALVVFGSDDPSYTASKIYPYLLARRPLLAIFHERSSVTRLIAEVGGATLVTFRSGESMEQIAARIHQAWFASRAFEAVTPLDERAFEPYLASSQAKNVYAWFQEVVAHAG